MTCISCNYQLEIFSNSDDECSCICAKCGIINYINNIEHVKKHKNIPLIKSKLVDVLTDPIFELITDEFKTEIISHVSKLGTHVKSTLFSFCLLYIEYKCKIKIMHEYLIKKKQRKYIIKILSNISFPLPMKFVRSPISYIEMFELNDNEKVLFANTSNCLMFLNACNKKDLHSINQKIYQVILLLRNNEHINMSASCNILDMIKFIIKYNITINDLIITDDKILSSTLC